MTFRFKKNKKQFYYNLVLGSFWVVFGLIGIFMEDTRWNDYAFLSIGILYLVLSFFNTRTHHLIITEEHIKQDYLFGKSIKVKDIKSITEFAGDISIKTDSKTFTIHKQTFESEVFSSIKQEVERLKLDLN